jgi:hypothetical protein
MTVSSEVSEVSYTGNGAATEFEVPFLFLAAPHLEVQEKVDGGSYSTLTLGVDYTVTGAGVATGGTVTRTTAPIADATLRIRRTLPLTQGTAFRTAGTFSAATHENAHDYCRMVDQQIARRIEEVVAEIATASLGDTQAGGGLTVTGGVLDVGAGPGILVDADDVSVDYGAAGQMVAITKAAASAGTDPDAARIDHKHDVTTATAVELTDSTSAEGNSTALARANHTHGHGERGGGSLHALAGVAAGFMSVADKARLDAMGEGLAGAVTTDDGTQTQLFTHTVLESQGAHVVEVTVVGYDETNQAGVSYRAAATFSVDGSGDMTQVEATTFTWRHEDGSHTTCDVDFVIGGLTIYVLVTGLGGAEIAWRGHGSVTSVYL